MNKKRVIILSVLGFFIIVGIVLVGIGINLDRSCPPNGSFINSYNYIQGDFNKDKLDKLSKAYIENIDIKYGKETVIDESNKTVETILFIPDMKKVLEEASTAFDKEIAKSHDKGITSAPNMEELINIFQNTVISQLNNVGKIEKKINITMTKEESIWKIVPNDEFVEVINGDLLKLFRENLNKGE